MAKDEIQPRTDDSSLSRRDLNLRPRSGVIRALVLLK